MTSNRGQTPSGGSRPLDDVVLLIGLLGIVFVCVLCVLTVGWSGLIVAGPLVGTLLILGVGLA